MIEFEIDGKKVATEQGKTVIEVADSLGIYIPRFCYHAQLSVAANCRMCLVEVEKSGKPLPACATPVTQGMRVFTTSEKALAAQRAVMEYLLINHPLDCPICDQGGECELQDLSMGYGQGFSRYNQTKRAVHDKNLGPLIATEMTRCIQCTRCVRFGEEIAGMREMGAYNRGEHLEIGTYIERAVKSEMSGNIIDVCPVGALTSKPYRFTARAWEMQQHSAIAPHDCIGSNIYVHTRGEEYSKMRHVMRVVPRLNMAVNEVWISDRDRFSYEALESADRIVAPRIKESGKWQEVDWPTALDFVKTEIQKIINEQGADKIGALASPNSTVEEFYLLQKLLRGLGCNNIDHRIQQTDFSDQADALLYPNLGVSLEDLERQNVILLIGSDVRQEQPLGCHRIRKATLQDGQVLCVNAVDYAFNFDVSDKIIVNSELIPTVLAKILKALTQAHTDANKALTTFLDKIEPGAAERTIAEKLQQGEKVAILLGAHAQNHPYAAMIRALATAIAVHSNATFGCFTAGANSAGAWLAGAVPHRGPANQSILKPGLNARDMFAKALPAYFLLGVEPELECANAALAMMALTQATLVVSLSSFTSQTMENYANVILPIAPFTENPGTFVNGEGRWQHFSAVSSSEARPAWKILRVLGNLLELEDFAYNNAHEVYQEIKQCIDNNTSADELAIAHPNAFPYALPAGKGLVRIGAWPMYRTDGLVRRAKALQESISAEVAVVRINSKLAQQLNLGHAQSVMAVQNNSQVVLPLVIDERVADNNVLIPAGLVETAGFGELFGAIELRSVTSA